MRLLAAIGVGGVLYLTPMVFHQAEFSASAVTGGVALAAAAGTAGRLLSGLLLDRGLSCTVPVLLAVAAQLLGDGLLLSAGGLDGYRAGQLLLGVAMGLYWPAIELAVPLACPPLASARAFALVRSADALGVAVGALIGALLAARGWLRGIYVVDMASLVLIALVLVAAPLPQPPRRLPGGDGARWGWLRPLLPLLAVTVLATAMPALMQSALPLDLVRGGLARPAMADSLGALVIGLQLGLLVLLQWPVGQRLARWPLRRGLALSLVSFAIGNGLLAVSALAPQGLLLLLLAQLPLALGQAAFLPTATEAVVQLSPVRHQGLAMALFSQCFALSSLVAPLLAGLLLDGQGHGLGLWLAMAVTCLAGLGLVRALGRSGSRGHWS
ncbi:MAG: MFS transporter [Cyanobacteriota bacterium]|nr:MFS transporter [Cyanobacteriota bacterium]